VVSIDTVVRARVGAGQTFHSFVVMFSLLLGALCCQADARSKCPGRDHVQNGRVVVLVVGPVVLALEDVLHLRKFEL
jgi:ABC-type spermidine/putrescine transport system permease subunit II